MSDEKAFKPNTNAFVFVKHILIANAQKLRAHDLTVVEPSSSFSASSPPENMAEQNDVRR